MIKDHDIYILGNYSFGVPEDNVERMQEMPILIMKKVPYEVIFDSELYDELADVPNYFYHLSLK